MAQRIVLYSVLRNLFVVVGIVGDNKRSVLFICWTKVFLSHFRVFYKAGTQLLWHFLAIPFSFSLYSLLSNYIFVRFFHHQNGNMLSVCGCDVLFSRILFYPSLPLYIYTISVFLKQLLIWYRFVHSIVLVFFLILYCKRWIKFIIGYVTL